MKILVVVARDTTHPTAAGGDQLMMLIARELAAAGNAVTVWCSRWPGRPRTERIEGVAIERIAPSRFLPPVVWMRFLTRGATSYDVVLEEVMGGERLPFLAPLFSHQPCIGMWYQDNRPLFQSVYGPAVASIATMVQSILHRLYRDRFLLAPSETSRSWLLKTGFDPGRVAVYHPKLPQSIKVASLPSFRERHNRFVCIGNFRPYKRFEEAVEVLERLHARVPNAELVLLGRADDARYLKRLSDRISSSNVANHVSILRNTSDETKFDVLSLAKALTIHSPIEGFGWIIPEAGLRGVPVVANPGTPSDALDAGVNGVKVAAGDVGAYVSTLARWMTDEAEWTRFSEGALRSAKRFVRPGLPPEVGELFERCRRVGGPPRHAPPP